MPPDLRFDTYYKYDDLTRILRAFAAEHPTLVKIDSIGHSHEGRDIWLATITNTQTGPDTEKPALWVDGSIHAQQLRKRPNVWGVSEGVRGSPRCSTSSTPSSPATHKETRTPSAAWTRAPSTSARASTRMAPSGQWPTPPA